MESKSTPSLERYFRALESIAVSADGLSASDVAECCNLPVATAHRLLQNLQRSELIASSGGTRKEYQLGDRLLRLLHAGSDTGWLSISVQPVLDKLAEEVRPENRPAVKSEIARLDATVAVAFSNSIDRDRAGIADRQGMGGPNRLEDVESVVAHPVAPAA